MSANERPRPERAAISALERALAVHGRAVREGAEMMSVLVARGDNARVTVRDLSRLFEVILDLADTGVVAAGAAAPLLPSGEAEPGPSVPSEDRPRRPEGAAAPSGRLA